MTINQIAIHPFWSNIEMTVFDYSGLLPVITIRFFFKSTLIHSRTLWETANALTRHFYANRATIRIPHIPTAEAGHDSPGEQ